MADDANILAVAVGLMSSCVPERLSAPRVSALLVRDGVVLETAYRGEREQGQHAEFTLLQQKVRSVDATAGATLYTTLEPCTTRSHDKLPCAEWIVQKKIARVVIGTLDPNPNICGRGYWRLVDAGIRVDFFPFDVAEHLLILNADFIRAHRAAGRIDTVLASLIQREKNSDISLYPEIGWGDCLSLQTHSDLSQGWPLAMVSVRITDDIMFMLPRELEVQYHSFVNDPASRDEKRLDDDGEKLMLIKNPTAFEEAPSLNLELRPTKYSVVEFFKDRVAPIRNERARYIDQFVRGNLLATFPHTFCMHLIVRTADSKLLATRRTQKVGYNIGFWSVSIEEQVKRSDLNDGSLLAWGQRALLEELGIDEKLYGSDNLRLLSIGLEADVLNVAAFVHAELRVESQDLAAVLRNLPLADREFDEFRYIDCTRESILGELFRPTCRYHSSSGFRLLLSLLRYFGSIDDSELYGLLPTSH